MHELAVAYISFIFGTKAGATLDEDLREMREVWNKRGNYFSLFPIRGSKSLVFNIGVRI